MLNAFYDYVPPLGANLPRYHGIDVAERRRRLAGDRFSTWKAKHVLREPCVMQRQA